ncbi:MAG: hypothetical protein ACRC38_03790, partial [Plesiomonas sp.]
RLLINRITFFLCHDDETNYKKCKCKECLTLSGVLSRHGNRLLSLYDFIVKQRLDVSVEPHLVRGAILDVFILPYLMRVVSELKTKFSQNRTLWYLDEYIKFVVREASKSEPLLKTFLKKHVVSVPCGLYVNKKRYQYNPAEYQSWDKFFNFASNELIQVNKRNEILSPEDDKKRWTEAHSWHCAGNIVHKLLSLMNASSKEDAPWRGSTLTTRLRWEYDFIYDAFLSLNKDVRFCLLRSDKVKLNLVINNSVECYLSLDRKAILQEYLSEEAKFGISFRKNALLDISLKNENTTKSSKPKKIAFNKYLKQPSTLNLRFDHSVRTKSSGDNDAEFNIAPREGVNIGFVIDTDGYFKLAFNKDATFDFRPNKTTAISFNVEDKREYGHKELRKIFCAFKYAISRCKRNGTTLAEVEEINAFCERVLNSTPTMDDIRQGEDKLKVLLKNGLNNRYTSFLAWCIFIAKSKHGKLKNVKAIQYCESRILEHQDDYFNRSLAYIRQLRHRAIHADFKHDMLHRLGYIRIYNKLVMGDFEHHPINSFQTTAPRMLSLLEGDRYTGEVINPFIELEKYIDSILRWDSGSSSKVIINESAIKSYSKGIERSFRWLISPNVSSEYKRENPQHDYKKMNLCKTCAVKLYPELMTLAGLRHNPKFISLNEREYEKLINLLTPCQCRRINDFELVENSETGNSDAVAYEKWRWEYLAGIYYSRPISL